MKHTHAEINTYAHTCFRTCATWSRFRRRDVAVQTCVGQSPILSRYVNVQGLKEDEGVRRGGMKGNGEQEKWATATLELSSVWQCSTTTTLVGLSAHYVDQRSHHRRLPSILFLIRDQEVPSLLRGDINVERNKLRDSEFMCRDLFVRIK